MYKYICTTTSPLQEHTCINVYTTIYITGSDSCHFRRKLTLRIHTYTYIYKYVHIKLYLRGSGFLSYLAGANTRYTGVCIYIYIYQAWASCCIWRELYIYTYLYMYTYIYISVYVYIHMYICMYLVRAFAVWRELTLEVPCQYYILKYVYISTRLRLLAIFGGSEH